MLNIFDNDGFGSPRFAGVAGARFEHFFCHEWGEWVVIDRRDGSITKCMDRGAAAERAAMLESIRRLVQAVADSARCN
jgi:hypothetical protein